MAFLELLKNVNVQSKEKPKKITKSQPVVTEAKDAADVLRSAGFKIRLVTPTSFGTQIDFAKLYNPAELEKTLAGYQIKIKDKSVFIVK